MTTQTILLILNIIKCELISVRNNFIPSIEILFGNPEINLATFVTENCIDVILHICILNL